MIYNDYNYYAGLEKDLPLKIKNGNWYFCKDTLNMYVDINNNRYKFKLEKVTNNEE